MKFKIDENLPIEVAALLRGQGYVADTVEEEGLGGCPDEKIVEQAGVEGRILFTLDGRITISWFSISGA